MRNVSLAFLFATACGSAYAQPGPQIAIDAAPVKLRAPYDVQIVREDGETLPTYASRGRFYVEGIAGERYAIEISNPTGHRVEAVVSVDGLDAVDGENGDLKKRGYIVPAWGETRIEGFRTSLADVAAFRFSSVDGSYAGQKGKARNVGVIAVALFEEDDPPPAAVATAAPRSEEHVEQLDADAGPRAPQAQRTRRSGLGTAFGESRDSAASYTRFVRSTTRPIAIAELRYNDAAGLTALGIPVEPMPDEDEIMTRETADPFPGGHFARPAR